MKLIKQIVKNMNTTQIVFKSHPQRKGYAQLADTSKINLVRAYGYSNLLNSEEFEAFQRKVEGKNINVLWHTA